MSERGAAPDLLARLRRELVASAGAGQHSAIAYAFETPVHVVRTFDEEVLVAVAGGQAVPLVDIVDELQAGSADIVGGPTTNHLAYQAMAFVPLASGRVSLANGTSKTLLAAIVEVEDYRGISAVPLLREGWPYQAGRHAGRTGAEAALGWVAPNPRAPAGLRAKWDRVRRGQDVPGSIATALAMMATSTVDDAGWPWVSWRLLAMASDGQIFRIRESAPPAPMAFKAGATVPSRRSALRDKVLKALEADREGAASFEAEMGARGEPGPKPAKRVHDPGRRPRWIESAPNRPDTDEDPPVEHLLPIIAGDVPMTAAHRALLEQMVGSGA